MGVRVLAAILFSVCLVVCTCVRNKIHEDLCKDTDERCAEKAAEGMCTTKPDDMLGCKLTCGLCGCMDTNEECLDWALEGECANNPYWIPDHCYRSCGLCQECKDNDGAQCPSSADPGECTGNRLSDCKRSCGVCEDCKDEHEKCAEWAGRGDCTSNFRFMVTDCKRSCHVCEVCMDKNEKCAEWAAAGKCTANPCWMLAICKRSCGVC